MRITVKIETADVGGGTRHTAVCKTGGCADGPGGTPWRSDPQVVKAAAEDLARLHRDKHRREQAPTQDTTTQTGTR